MNSEIKFGLKDDELKAIVEVFSNNPEIWKLILFGSRAKGTFKPGSDIDLAIVGKNLSLNDVINASIQLDELVLPFIFDIVIFDQITEMALREHIERVGVILFEKGKVNMKYQFMQRAIQLAQKGMESNAGGPFGAVVVKNNRIIAEGFNQVTSTNDPTAHAEIIAIREACKVLGSFQLEDCEIFTSCEPCPMCLGAIYWARPKKVFFGCTRKDAMEINFDDQFIYDELANEMNKRKIEFENLMREEANVVFKIWKDKPNKTEY